MNKPFKNKKKKLEELENKVKILEDTIQTISNKLNEITKLQNNHDTLITQSIQPQISQLLNSFSDLKTKTNENQNQQNSERKNEQEISSNLTNSLITDPLGAAQQEIKKF
jgi:vacuolar-type H+-ATPase subunit I/STV1